MSPITAVIFDMDGLLIDSEPLWQNSMIEVFARVGIHLDRDMCRQTMGVRIDEVVEIWHGRLPWNGPSKEEVRNSIVADVVHRVREQGVLLPGVLATVQDLTERGIPLALASSSQFVLIDAVLDHFYLRDYFQIVHSAESEPYGKPHPGVYLTTASLLGKRARECLAVEDSMNGLVAAKAAMMRCLMVPDVALREDPRLSLADLVVESLEKLDGEAWEQFFND